MKIDSLKDLKALLRLCRQEGVEAFELGDIKFNLSPNLPVKAQTRYKAEETVTTFTPGGITEEVQIPTTGLTQEQLLFYSSQGPMSDEQQ